MFYNESTLLMDVQPSTSITAATARYQAISVVPLLDYLSRVYGAIALSAGRGETSATFALPKSSQLWGDVVSELISLGFQAQVVYDLANQTQFLKADWSR